jgi:hypothetical protein
MALIFFGAGIAKIRHSGLTWVLSDNMAVMLLQHQYHVANADPVTSLGVKVAQYGWLCQCFAAGAVIFETAYPLALFSTRARSVIVPGVFLMQVGIRLLMGPTFNQYLICNLFWVPWDQIVTQITDRRSSWIRQPLQDSKWADLTKA